MHLLDLPGTRSARDISSVYYYYKKTSGKSALRRRAISQNRVPDEWIYLPARDVP